MAIDKLQGPSKRDKMLQIQNAQKVIPRSIFDVSKGEKDSESSTIHSGQFMLSRLHEEKDDDDDEEAPIFSDDSKDFSASMGYDFLQANKETSQTYSFGPKSTSTLSIDASLTKLFECMTLAYSGKITSPKWKPFRGMHLTIKDKVRLNNIIWREWHMQYIFQMRSVVCQFATPLSDYIHTKPEAVVLEGKYWKRRLDTVTKEYKRWRRYYRDRILQSMPETPSLFPTSSEHLSELELLERVKDVSGRPRNVQQSSTDLSLLNADIMDMDFSDNLWSTLNQPFAFPNPRELSQLTCADLIQPGLVQLQPNLEDFMDIDNLQELLAVSKPSSNNTNFTTSTVPSPPVPDLPTSMDMSQSQLFQNSSMALGLLDPAIFNSGSGSNSTAGISMLTALAALSSSSTNNSGNSVLGASAGAGSSSGVLNPSSLFPSDAQMILDDGSSSKQMFGSSGQQQAGFLGALFGMEPSPKPDVQSPQTLTLQSNTVPQNMFSSQPAPTTFQTIETQQLFGSQQAVDSQHIVGSCQTVGGSQQVIGSQQTLSSQQTLGSQQTFGSQQAIGSQQTVGVGVHQVVGSPLTLRSPQLVSSPQTLSSPKHTVIAQQTASHQQMGGHQPVQTVNLAGLGLTQSQPPSSTPSRSYAHVASVPGVQAGGTAQISPAKTTKGRVTAKVSPRTSPSHTAATGRTASGHAVASAGKKDVFIVPQGKPVTTPRKPRTIAPAPSPPRSAASSSPSPSMQSTYLAQLLTKGTYPGALISVKKEPASNTVVTLATSNFTPILPALPVSSAPCLAPVSPSPSTPTPSFTATRSPVSSAAGLKLPSEITVGITKVSGVDFPTSVLLAAASSAIGTTPSSLKDALRLNPSNTATASMASEMSPTPATSRSSQSPMQVAVSPSPVPSATTPSSSPLATVFSDTPSPISSPSAISMSFQPISTSPTSNREEGGLGVRVGVHTEQRRVAHLSAEQKRRCNLKTGFDLLHTLVPSLAQNPKVSKATMLQKTAEHCRKMKAERAQMQREATILKQEIESLNSAISNVQAQLPETGVPVTRQRVDHMKDMFEEYVRSRTIQNWKFWIFSIIIRSLFDSYNNMVSTANVEELCRTVAAWLDQHCSLVSLRPTVLNALRHLSMSTSILTEPSRVREQATEAVTKGRDGKGGKTRDSIGLP